MLKRNIKSNIKQFLSVIVIVLLCTTLLSGFISNSATLKRSVNKYFSETNLANVWVQTDLVTQQDEDFLVKNGINYDKRFYFETTSIIENSSKNNATKVFVSKGKISTPYIEKGQNGCMIDKNVASSYNIKTHMNNIIFNVPYGDLNLTLKFVITGTMSFDECADSYSSWPVFIDENVFLSAINAEINNLGQNLDSVPYNQILIKSDDEQGVKNKIGDYFAQYSSRKCVIFDRNSVESVVMLNAEVEQSEKMILVFPIIFMVVSILVILTTINQLILQEKSKIGTLKSVGVQDKKILRHYSSYGAVLCAIGSVVGLVLGPLIIPGIMFIKYDLLYSIPEDYIKLRFSWWLVAVFVMMVVLGYIVSYLACHNILHKKPIECFKPAMNMKFKNTAKTSSKKLPIPLKMAVRNVKVKPLRTIMAMIGVAGCTALLLCGFGIGDTLNYSTSHDLDGVFNYDVTSSYVDMQFENNLQKLSGIKEYELFESLFVQSKNGENVKDTMLYKINNNSKLCGIKLNENDVCLSHSVAKELGVKVGDYIEISQNGNICKLEVTKIEKTSIYNGIFASKSIAFDSELKTYGVWLKTDSPEELTKEINKINGNSSAMTKAKFEESVNQKISSIDLMTNTLKFFAIALAIVVLFNLIFLVLKERAKEIATLKVLGVTSANVVLSLMLELLFVGLVGGVVGMFLGFPLLMLVLSINKTQVMNFLYHIYPLSYVLSMIIILSTILVVCLLSVLRIKKVNMIESLKSVE